MIQFFSPDVELSLSLPPDESLHSSRVLRKKEGDEITVVDGIGHSYRCRVTRADSRKTEVEILEKKHQDKTWKNHIRLAVAPTKNSDRMSWLVEKAVEIGVDEIVFVDCDRNERHKLSADRLKRNAVSAMKQSLKVRLPEISGLIRLKDFVKQEAGGEKFFGYCDEESEKVGFSNTYKPGSDVTVVIGPEGDFSPSEVEMLKKAGYVPVTFGESRLRTETAALYGLQAVHIINSLN